VATSAPEGNFGTIVSGLKIPFPGNRDSAKQRLVRNAALLLGKAENLVLLAPSGGQLAVHQAFWSPDFFYLLPFSVKNSWP
jgi:hypothetical protein